MKKIIFLVAIFVIGISSYATSNVNYKNIAPVKTNELSVQCTYTQHSTDNNGVHTEKQVTETTSRVGCALRKVGSALQNIGEAIDDIF